MAINLASCILILSFVVRLSLATQSDEESDHKPPHLRSTNTIIERTKEVASVLTLNGTTVSRPLEDVRYRCFNQLGKDLSTQSCLDAVRQLDVRSTIPQTWGRRNSGRFDHYLPQRFQSTDGTCFIEPVPNLRDSSAYAVSSQADIVTGSIALIRRCAGGTPSTGGVVGGLGEEGKMNVLLGKMVPHVLCFGAVSRSPRFRQNCQDILDTMDDSVTPRLFGPASEHQPVDVTLPLTLKAGYLNRCIVEITTSGQPDVWKFINAWETVQTINAMCIRQGRKGLWTGLGAHRRLSLVVTEDGVSENPWNLTAFF